MSNKLMISKKEIYKNNCHEIELEAKPFKMPDDLYHVPVDIEVNELTCKGCGKSYPQVLIDGRVITGGTMTTWNKDGDKIETCGCNGPF